jgi:hypothetical protein
MVESSNCIPLADSHKARPILGVVRQKQKRIRIPKTFTARRDIYTMTRTNVQMIPLQTCLVDVKIHFITLRIAMIEFIRLYDVTSNRDG